MYRPFERRKRKRRKRARVPAARREYSRWYNIRRKYGLSKDQWYEIYNAQDGRCYICHRTEREVRRSRSRYLTVDHCHESGRVRGLLCVNCNGHVLPGIKEDPIIAARVLDYLTRQTNYGKVPA